MPWIVLKYSQHSDRSMCLFWGPEDEGCLERIQPHMPLFHIPWPDTFRTALVFARQRKEVKGSRQRENASEEPSQGAPRGSAPPSLRGCKLLPLRDNLGPPHAAPGDLTERTAVRPFCRLGPFCCAVSCLPADTLEMAPLPYTAVFHSIPVSTKHRETEKHTMAAPTVRIWAAVSTPCKAALAHKFTHRIGRGGVRPGPVDMVPGRFYLTAVHQVRPSLPM